MMKHQQYRSIHRMHVSHAVFSACSEDISMIYTCGGVGTFYDENLENYSIDFKHFFNDFTSKRD